MKKRRQSDIGDLSGKRSVGAKNPNQVGRDGWLVMEKIPEVDSFRAGPLDKCSSACCVEGVTLPLGQIICRKHDLAHVLVATDRELV